MDMKKLSTRIYAKAVLADIHAGTSASALMEKYRFSAGGLKSLFRKPGESGVIRYIRTCKSLPDLKAGIRDSQLMEKYKASKEGLRKVLKQSERVTFRYVGNDARVYHRH